MCEISHKFDAWRAARSRLLEAPMDTLKPRVVVLSKEPAEGAGLAEASLLQQAADVTSALTSRGYEVQSRRVGRPNLFEVVAAIAQDKDSAVVFNLCGAIDGATRHEPLVAGLLDLYGVRFTGNCSAVLGSCLDKRITKALLFAAGIPTPGARVFRTTPKAEAVRDMAFPLVVKPLREDGSVGVTADSYVRTPDELCQRVEEAIRRYQQPVLGEVYLSGREFSVSITGAGQSAQALPASEIVFDGYGEDEPRLVTHDAKWKETGCDDRQARLRSPAEVGEHLKVSLTTAALAAYRALECRDYARIDLRLNHRGTPHVLEVNPNPDLSRKAEFARTVEASGDEYEDFVERLVQWAWSRA